MTDDNEEADAHEDQPVPWSRRRRPVADRAPDDDDPDEYPEDEKMPLGVWFSASEAAPASAALEEP